MTVRIYRSATRSEANEDAEMQTFFNWVRRKRPALAGLAIHIPNESKRTHAQAARAKTRGLVAGAADVIIPGRQTFVCELKRSTGGRVSTHQQKYLEAADAAGAFACVAHGWEAAMEALLEWEKSETK